MLAHVLSVQMQLILQTVSRQTWMLHFFFLSFFGIKACSPPPFQKVNVDIVFTQYMLVESWMKGGEHTLYNKKKHPRLEVLTEISLK